MTPAGSKADPARVPRATYRLQFHNGFTLRDALQRVPFFEELGVSHLYASPLLKAVPGSTHGYDVCDFSRLNPELGTEDDLRNLVSALRERGMGLVLDIVPNHMATSADNPWWWDVLAHGQSSRYANHFDIDWAPLEPRLRGRVLVPVLGDEYDKVLYSRSFIVQIDRAMPVLRYHDHKFPLALTPGVVRQRPLAQVIDELNASPRALDAVLEQQHYRLDFWRQGDTHLNYRRFFNIASLVSIRVEDPVIFDAVHECILRWWREGLLDGLRVDCIDGLRDPEGYLRRLRAAAPGVWLVVEKILGPRESLPEDWPVEGTSGYDFLNRVTSLFIDPAGEQPLTGCYREFTGEPVEFAPVARDAQRWVLRELLKAEVNRLTHLLVKSATRHWRGGPLAQHNLRDALIEVIAGFPVYRTYIPPAGNRVSETDELVISGAVDLARQERPELPAGVFELIKDLLLLRWDGAEERDFVLRFQQLTGPAMAKGVEDTACYRYNRLIALNTVGGDPGQFGAPHERFHLHCLNDQIHWPNAMLATSTHDTKRGEDVRARLCLLSELPADWARAVQRWSQINARYRSGRFPDRNIEYFYYQTLVGAWPLALDRAWTVMDKAACEARQHTTWTARNPDYDRILREFVAHTLGDRSFLADLSQFVQRLVEPGYLNSLSQTLLKLTSPGVPDTYQGNSLWDFSLVDPDNRRPVDYAAREAAMTAMRRMSPEQVWQRRAEGFPKLWVFQKTLQLRRRKPEWFDARSSYQILRLHGPKARHAVAFQRGGGLVVVVPRLVVGLGGNWAGSTIELPGGNWQNVFTGECVAGGSCGLADLLRQFPVALLERSEA